MLFFFEKFNWASGPVFALASFRLRQDYADKLLKEMILQSSKLRFTLLDNNQLWYLFFYQGCAYIYVVRQEVAQKMRAGPSEPAYRSRLQTTSSCCG